jgi:hypothetical protein
MTPRTSSTICPQAALHDDVLGGRFSTQLLSDIVAKEVLNVSGEIIF